MELREKTRKGRPQMNTVWTLQRRIVWRLCGRRGEWGRRDDALGQRFLMGWRESDSCWGLFWGCRASGGFPWGARHFTVFSLSSLPFYCRQSWKYIKFWRYRRKGLGCREKPPVSFYVWNLLSPLAGFLF